MLVLDDVFAELDTGRRERLADGWWAARSRCWSPPRCRPTCRPRSAARGWTARRRVRRVPPDQRPAIPARHCPADLSATPGNPASSGMWTGAAGRSARPLPGPEACGPVSPGERAGRPAAGPGSPAGGRFSAAGSDALGPQLFGETMERVVGEPRLDRQVAVGGSAGGGGPGCGRPGVAARDTRLRGRCAGCTRGLLRPGAAGRVR